LLKVVHRSTEGRSMHFCAGGLIGRELTPIFDEALQPLLMQFAKSSWLAHETSGCL
jgi:hypothetical protein